MSKHDLGILTLAQIDDLLAQGAVLPRLPRDPAPRQPTTHHQRLGEQAWEVPAGLLPLDAPVSEVAAEVATARLDLREGALL